MSFLKANYSYITSSLAVLSINELLSDDLYSRSFRQHRSAKAKIRKLPITLEQK